MTASLEQIVGYTGPLLLDFDGPICHVFAGYPATSVADRAREVAIRYGESLPLDIAETGDPLAVLHWSATLDRPDVVLSMEQEISGAELRAIETAEETPGARALIRAAAKSSRPVAVVSNNSAGAIREFLRARSLADYVSSIAGRPAGHPGLMKPHPHLLTRTIGDLGSEPGECVFIGDSMTDIEAARAAGVRVIAYANRPSKVELFRAAAPDALVTSMGNIADAIR
ncbi:HAD family hydrolase [Cryptosporangium phraense]|uniref:HAD family hydrolase n=1 Tax=Cryptosporangium phraense TaxID=2593070 RepID=A0A545AQY4_9ACTN|nr:HAD-IA family hydrolase [Cryptosporangium phraense]TQS43728.1 HAD family hydrolase [Cryptosporangium phraense]